MNEKILILQNVTHEEPGLITEILDEFNLNYEIIDLSHTLTISNIKNYSLIIIMGGPDSANDKSEKIMKEIEIIQQARNFNIPILGICLGLQLLIKSNGGEVYINPVREIGFKHNFNEWYIVSLTENGLKDPIFKNINNNFIVFQLHGETVKLNNEMCLLGTSKYCQNQIVKFGINSYGFQFHFEVNENLFENILKLAPELKGYDLESLRTQYNEIKEKYLSRGRQIFINYIKILGFI